jgi:hypothetical protein
MDGLGVFVVHPVPSNEINVYISVLLGSASQTFHFLSGKACTFNKIIKVALRFTNTINHDSQI